MTCIFQTNINCLPSWESGYAVGKAEMKEFPPRSRVFNFGMAQISSGIVDVNELSDKLMYSNSLNRVTHCGIIPVISAFGKDNFCKLEIVNSVGGIGPGENELFPR